MIQRDNPQEQVQALRSVNKNPLLDPAAPTRPSEIIHVETMVDPETQKEVVLWDDILQAFGNAIHVRHETKVVPFLKGKNLRVIAAVPNIVLDVIVESLAANKRAASPQDRQPEVLPVPLQDDKSTLDVEVVSRSANPTPSVTSTSSASSTPSAPCVTTSKVRRNPIYGLEEAAFDNYSHIDKPLSYSSARRPQALSNDQTSMTVEDLSISSCPDSDNTPQLLRGPQNTTTDTPVELDLVQIGISASHGNKNAQFVLGNMYRDGKGVPKNYQDAMDWYLKAVKQGDVSGQQNVAYLYHRGYGVPQDYDQSMAWYRKAADQGHTGAQHNIGLYYHRGRGVSKDYVQAMEWFLKAAEQGYADSQHYIGLYYHHGRGVSQDYAQAMTWYLKAAVQYIGAQRYIGFCYHLGQGVPQDYAQAMAWYLKAAVQGNMDAQHYVGLYYHHGRGVSQDDVQAIEWFFKAAEQGCSDSQTYIGHHYHYGLGVTQDYTEAAVWYQKAADQGSSDASKSLEDLREGAVL
ncbi:hypothetical protein BGZ96_008793 [Linnemannia gamsii]|uniref:HCP-like protein n=1 Tax=Linnemannia gamsii TaxID=64522 RepID=A0ABQ7JZT3_9FUNG|nr:hypothetical protein BGZ96_008793 [Linnemannia gamsii]